MKLTSFVPTWDVEVEETVKRVVTMKVRAWTRCGAVDKALSGMAESSVVNNGLTALMQRKVVSARRNK